MIFPLKDAGNTEPFRRASFFDVWTKFSFYFMNPNQQAGAPAKKVLLKLYLLSGVIALACFFTACNKSPDSSVSFSNIVTASDVDSNNAPTALADTFSTQQKVIYVVAAAKEIAPGTRLAAKWSRDGTVIQVSDEVTAAQGYRNSNIEFHMVPGANGWVPGNYTVQIVVNGQPGPKATFTIK